MKSLKSWIVRKDKSNRPSRRGKPAPIRKIGKVEFIPHKFRLRRTGDKHVDAVIGVAWDKAFKTYSSTMWAAGRSPQGVTAEEELDGLLRWSRFMDLYATQDNIVDTLTWRTQTSLGDHLRSQDLADEMRTEDTRDDPIDSELQKILDHTVRMAKDVVVHETTLTLSIHAPSLSSEIKRVGSPEELLKDQVYEFMARAQAGQPESPLGLVYLQPLDYNTLLKNNHMVLDPVNGQILLQEWDDWVQFDRQLNQSLAWPVYANFDNEDYCRIGDTYHIGFYVEEFPSSGMFTDTFWALIDLPITKTVAVSVRMIPHGKAQTAAEWRTTGTASRVSDRVSEGFRATAQQQVEAEIHLSEERELAERLGEAGDVRVYFDVTGTSVDEVRDNARQLRYAANDASFALRPLTGRHEIAAIAAMPIGRGMNTIFRPRSIIGF